MELLRIIAIYSLSIILLVVLIYILPTLQYLKARYGLYVSHVISRRESLRTRFSFVPFVNMHRAYKLKKLLKSRTTQIQKEKMDIERGIIKETYPEWLNELGEIKKEVSKRSIAIEEIEEEIKEETKKKKKVENKKNMK